MNPSSSTSMEREHIAFCNARSAAGWRQAEKLAFSVKEAAEILSIGRTTLYARVKAGDLKATKCGRKTLFLASDLAAFVERLQSCGGAR